MELVIDTIDKSFDSKKILKSGSFTFEKGKIYGLLGRNGAGKTTLFNCISKNLSVDHGEIYFIDESGQKIQYDNTEIGLVHATPHLPGFMTGFEFVKFFIDINKKRLPQAEHPKFYLDKVGIAEDDQHRLLKDYSHGMQNKVQMVVMMMLKLPVLLLDEPLTSFDVVAAHEMKELIIGLKSESIIIFSTHILQLAQDLCDEIVLLHHGRLRGIPAADIHSQSFEGEVVSLLSVSEELEEVTLEEELRSEVGAGNEDN
ncbi:ABC transporter ATP-binding protein [Vagococcus salmoninarum]|uniref:ABC transporter ATP-binding protein n=1 Tax=Vagococcus salmoninarum TaxID=2739 RepID=UPI003F96E325